MQFVSKESYINIHVSMFLNLWTILGGIHKKLMPGPPWWGGV